MPSNLQTRAGLALLLLMAGSPAIAPARPNPEQDEDAAVQAVTDAGGRVGVERPGGVRRVVEVDLLSAKGVAVALLKKLKGLPALDTLKVTFNGPAGEEFKEIGAPGSLQVLVIRGNGVPDTAIKHLQSLPSLGTLDLKDTHVSDAGLRDLAGLERLRVLDLSGTRVTDAGPKDLAGLKQLRSLVLSASQVTDAGVLDLRKALPKLDVAR